MIRFALLLALTVATPALALDRGPPAQTFGPLTVPSANVSGGVSAGSIQTPNLSAGTVQTSTVSAADASGTCDPSAWNSYFSGTLGPVPRDYCSKVSGKIEVLYPGLNGLGDESGQGVPPNTTTFLPMAQHVIQAKTTQNNTRQESGLAINFRNVTGGGGLSQTQHNQKVALSVFARAEPGGSNMWGINTDVHVLNGVGNYFAAGREADHTNFNGDYKPGGCTSLCPSTAANGQQINNVFWGDWLSFVGYPITAGTYYNGVSNPNSANMYYGMLFAATPGVTAVRTGLVSDATINDSTNAFSTLKVYGNHSDTINTQDATVTRIITGKAGQSICLNAAASCIVYDGLNGQMSINGGKLLVADDGRLTVSGSINAQGLPTAGGTVKGSLCVDTAGNIYVKTTPGSCL